MTPRTLDALGQFQEIAARCPREDIVATAALVFAYRHLDARYLLHDADAIARLSAAATALRSGKYPTLTAPCVESPRVIAYSDAPTDALTEEQLSVAIVHAGLVRVCDVIAAAAPDDDAAAAATLAAVLAVARNALDATPHTAATAADALTAARAALTPEEPACTYP